VSETNTLISYSGKIGRAELAQAEIERNRTYRCEFHYFLTAAESHWLPGPFAVPFDWPLRVQPDFQIATQQKPHK